MPNTNSIANNPNTNTIKVSVGGIQDHTKLTNIGTNTHPQIDTHIADDTIHFTEGSIDHENIQNIGTNSHALIDLHLANLANPHQLSWGQILGALSNQVDLWPRVSIWEVIHDLTDMQQFLNVEDDMYDIPANSYKWDNNIVFDKQIRQTTLNGFYLFSSRNINSLTYNGTEPFLINNSTGQALKIINTFFITPNATAIKLENLNSLLIDLGVFGGCQKAMEITNAEFITISEPPMVGCGMGAEFIDVKTTNISFAQWNAGPDTGGIAYTISGPLSERLVVTRVDSRPALTESMFFIDPDAVNLDVDISAGIHTGPGPFFSGTRDQTDVDILLTGVKRIQESSYVIGVYNTVEEPTVFASPGDTEVIEGTFAVSTSERFSRTEVGGKSRITYLGKEPLRGVSITATASVAPVNGGVVQYCQQIRFTPLATGIAILDPQSTHDVFPSSNNPKTNICATIIDMVTGDYFEYVSTAVGHSTNANFSTVSIVVKG
jgi:hypothetical protein